MNSADRPRSAGVSRLSVFLLELIIVIVFFAMASAVLLQVFAKADQLSDRAENLSCAAAAATDAAEGQRILSPEEIETRRYYYDENWEPLAEGSGPPSFYAEAAPEFSVGEAGTLVSFTITVRQIGESRKDADQIPLYTLQTKKYYSGKYPQSDGTQEKEEVQ
ncbi:hypothetical protein [Bacilliculturomica massiliensis]|uniref:hypothetical protein n=1 Tax=Bacilliculturomica massiliensis TaxID=1917867 RepID=UPI0010325E8A|nr:hypothetical protein [Bacilliculturomica massiliensis]